MESQSARTALWPLGFKPAPLCPPFPLEAVLELIECEKSLIAHASKDTRFPMR